MSLEGNHAERQSLTKEEPLSNIPTSVLPVDLPEIIGGKYRPRSVLGFGATGTVYCVEHTFTGDLLALKVLQPHLSASPEAITRFKGEARTAAKLRGRHVVRVFDADVARELGGAPYLVMELLEGRNLDQVAGADAIAPAVVVDWLRQAAVPLTRAHALGIVHRDLKPENLFLTNVDDGAPPLLKVLDFGIARIAESPGMTRSGELFGTPLYMAPEQARGDLLQIGPATDIFALGLIAYKLLTGAEYRAESGLAQMLNEILNDPPQAPSQRGYALGDGFDRWFLQACDPEPSRRFASVREQVEALAVSFGLPEDPIAADGPPSSGPSTPSSPTWSPRFTEVRRSPPSGGAPGSVRVTTIERGAASPLKLDGVATLAGADVEELSLQPNRWRAAFFAVCAISGIALVLTAWRGFATTAQAAAARPSGCPTETVATAAMPPSVPDPPQTVPVPPVIPAEPTPAKTTTTAMRPTVNDSVRAATVRPVPSPVIPAHKTTADDDPLSDQK